jgi:transposase InsO family protein
MPHSIITDNGSNFTSGKFKEYYDKLGVQLKFASVAHAQTNGQVEKTNRLICSGIKKMVANTVKKGQMCLGRRTPLRHVELMNNSKYDYAGNSFFLVQDALAVLPAEVTHDAPRVTEYEEVASTKALKDDMDVLEEARDVALARATAYQQNLQNYHSCRLRPRSF